MMYYVITPVQVKSRADTFRKILIMNNFQNQSHFLQTFIANKHVKKGSAVLKRVVEQAVLAINVNYSWYPHTFHPSPLDFTPTLSHCNPINPYIHEAMISIAVKKNFIFTKLSFLWK